MTDKTYTVLKAQQNGHDAYARGDERTMSEADAKTLVDAGALKLNAENKPKPDNKAKAKD